MDNTTNDKGVPSDSTPPTPRSHSNSAHDQRKCLLDYLRTHGSIDTVTARRDLNIMMPGARIHELRHRFGHTIDKVMVKRATDCGKLHTVGLYVLKDRHGEA